jgi:RNA polymerase sigma-70 factor (ECF subfamily)
MSLIDETALALLRAAQDDPSEHFAGLQCYLEDDIYRFVRRLIGSNDADDIVQDTFIALYLNLERIEPPEKLLPFLYRVARNRCYDILRKDQRHQTTSLDAIAEPHGLGTFSHPEDRTHWRMMMDQVLQAIELLTEPQRQTLILYCEEAFSINEVAEIMNTSPGTVKSRLYYARQTLRRILSADDFDFDWLEEV